MTCVRGVLALVLLTSLAACGTPASTASGGGSAPPPANEVPDGPPWIAGVVADVSNVEPVTEDCVSEADADGDGTVSSDDPPVCDPDPAVYGTLLVEGDVEAQGGETAASVSVGKDVPLTDGDGGSVSWEDISRGSQVAVWTTGEIAESYPVQVRATRIALLRAGGRGTQQRDNEGDRRPAGEEAQPPDSTLVVDGNGIGLPVYTYCWSGPGSAVCSDGGPSEDPPTVRVPRGAQGVLEFQAGAQPDTWELGVRRGSTAGDLRMLDISQGGSVILDLPRGDWYLSLSTTWPEGDAHYAGAVRITR